MNRDDLFQMSDLRPLSDPRDGGRSLITPPSSSSPPSAPVPPDSAPVSFAPVSFAPVSSAPDSSAPDSSAPDSSAPDSSSKPSPRNTFVFALSAFSALGGFLFGYDTGVVSGAMLLLKREMNLSTLWQELLVSSTVGAAAVSALLGAALNNAMGRRRCILLASFTFCVGGVVMSLAPDKEVLLLGRITVGLGIGVASMTVPVYMAEVSPPLLRGQLVTVNTLFITGGQFTASVIDGAFSYVQGGWRYMLGLSVVPALVQFVGFLFLPESPRWLLQKERQQEALRVLKRIRGGCDVEEEFQSIRSSLEEERRATGGGGGVVFFRILRHAPTRRALILGCGLQMFQQLSGINTVMYYSATILQMSGVRDVQKAIWLSAVTAFTNFLFTLVGVWLVERVGRRRLTVASLIGTCVSLLVLALGFLLSALNSPAVTLPSHDNNTVCGRYSLCEGCMLDPDCGFCYKENRSAVLDSSCVSVNPESTDRAANGRCVNQSLDPGLVWAYNFCPSSFSWIIVLGLVLYLAAFAPGMGPMPWTVNSEIFPLWARSTGNACSAGVNWTFNVLVSLTFLHVAQYLTYYGAFFLYAALVVLGLVFVLVCLPETRGLQLEEMERLFSSGLASCPCSGPRGSDVRYTRHKPGPSYGALDSDIAYITLR